MIVFPRQLIRNRLHAVWHRTGNGSNNKTPFSNKSRDAKVFIDAYMLQIHVHLCHVSKHAYHYWQQNEDWDETEEYIKDYVNLHSFALLLYNNSFTARSVQIACLVLYDVKRWDPSLSWFCRNTSQKSSKYQPIWHEGQNQLANPQNIRFL